MIEYSKPIIFKVSDYATSLTTYKPFRKIESLYVDKNCSCN